MRTLFSTLARTDPWRRLSKLPLALRHLGWRRTWTHGLRVLGEMSDRALMGPELMRLCLTDFICNHKCPMCTLQVMDVDTRQQLRRTEKKTRMTLEHYQGIFSTLPAGLTEVNLVGGGEPLMHPDCVKVMRLIKQRNLRGSLITNGALMNADVAEAMLDMEWDDTRVSVNAGDRETYLAVNGADNFAVTRENLLRFTDLRERMGKRYACGLRLYFVLQRQNIHAIEDMVRLAEEVGADSIEWDPIIPLEPDAKLTPLECAQAVERLETAATGSSVPSNLGRIRELLRPAAETPVLVAGPVTVDTGDAQPPKDGKQAAAHFLEGKQCIVGFRQVFIRSNGDVLPCCFSDDILGNLQTTNFSEVWYGPPFARLRKRLMNGSFPHYCHSSPEKCWPHVLRETKRRPASRG